MCTVNRRIRCQKDVKAGQHELEPCLNLQQDVERFFSRNRHQPIVVRLLSATYVTSQKRPRIQSKHCHV